MTYVRDHLTEHLSVVRRYSRSLTRDRDLSDDIVSVVCIRALTSEHTFRDSDPRSLEAWLITITHNEFVSRLKKRRAEFAGIEFVDRHVDPDQDLNVEVAQMGRMLSRLPPELQSLLLDYTLRRDDYDELAVRHNIPVGTVRSRISRGRVMMQKMRDDA